MRIFLFLVLFGAAIRSEGQGVNWPPMEWRDTIAVPPYYHRPPYQSLRGYILFMNGDSATGMIRIPYNSSNFFLLTTNEFQAKRFRIKSARYMHVYVPSLGRDYAELFTFDIKHMRDRFWRLVKKKDSISIYDKSTGIFTDRRMSENNISASLFNEQMVMMVGSKPIKIYGKFRTGAIFGLNKRNKSENLIIKFINNRYQTHFTIQDFKSGIDMIDYILDHEPQSL
jgi:hypothetical protein